MAEYERGIERKDGEISLCENLHGKIILQLKNNVLQKVIARNLAKNTQSTAHNMI